MYRTSFIYDIVFRDFLCYRRVSLTERPTRRSLLCPASNWVLSLPGYRGTPSVPQGLADLVAPSAVRAPSCRLRQPLFLPPSFSLGLRMGPSALVFDSRPPSETVPWHTPSDHCALFKARL